METSIKSPQTGRIYYPKQIIGKGVQGTVYLYVGNDEIPYACKVIQPNTDKWSLEAIAKLEIRIQQEVVTLNKSTHQNVVNYVEYFELINKGIKTRYLISEYCDGETLGQLLAKQKRLNEQQALPIIKQLAQGLHHIHQQSVIHRDIKPENIMFKQGIPKFIDFGLSKYIDESNNGQIYTIEVGSPMYMAPELLEESGYYDLKVDIWALGIVFYLMLTGQFLWRSPEHCSKQELLNIIQENDTVRFPHEIMISEKLQNILTLMLQLDSEQRLDSEQLLQMLQ